MTSWEGRLLVLCVIAGANCYPCACRSGSTRLEVLGVPMLPLPLSIHFPVRGDVYKNKMLPGVVETEGIVGDWTTTSRLHGIYRCHLDRQRMHTG
jgi:hypothetical protein